jgi:hypothetical protein
MDLTAIESAVMQRFAEKCVSAGGPKNGYVLRRLAIARGLDDGADVDAGISSLITRGFLAASENGDFLFLTEAGVESLTAVAV